jgi:hypothetical protein
MPVALRAIDRLRKAANMEPIKKEVELSDGSIFELWFTPLTMAERERAQRQAKSDDASAFALQLLINKAQDENGTKLFKAGEIDILKNEVKDKDLQSLMLAILTEETEATDDMKSTAE